MKKASRRKNGRSFGGISGHRKEVSYMEWITAIVQGNPLTTAIVAGLSVLYVAGKKLIEIYKDYKLKGGK